MHSTVTNEMNPNLFEFFMLLFTVCLMKHVCLHIFSFGFLPFFCHSLYSTICLPLPFCFPSVIFPSLSLTLNPNCLIVFLPLSNVSLLLIYPEAQKLPYYASYGRTRLAIHALCTSHYLDLVITFIICINVITMSLEHYDQPQVTALLEEDRAMLGFGTLNKSAVSFSVSSKASE